MSLTKTGEALPTEALERLLEELPSLELRQLQKAHKDLFQAANLNDTAGVLRRKLRKGIQARLKGAAKESPEGPKAEEPATAEVPKAATLQPEVPSRWLDLVLSDGRTQRLILSDAHLQALGFAQQADGSWIPAGTVLPGRRGPRRAPTLEAGRDTRLPAAGGSLSRTYKGRTYVVEVLEKGFTCEGHPYRSLSALASEITGHPTNGFDFFGLNTREVARD